MTYFSRDLDEREIHNRWVDPRLHRVRVAGLRNYLLKAGWTEVPPDRPNYLVFQEPNCGPDEPLFQFVPMFEVDRAFPSLVYDLIGSLASIEDRYAGDVLTDILRCQDAAAKNGDAHAETRTEAVAG